jgi:hypothetical protein
MADHSDISIVGLFFVTERKTEAIGEMYYKGILSA